MALSMHFLSALLLLLGCSLRALAEPCGAESCPSAERTLSEVEEQEEEESALMDVQLLQKTVHTRAGALAAGGSVVARVTADATVAADAVADAAVAAAANASLATAAGTAGAAGANASALAGANASSAASAAANASTASAADAVVSFDHNGHVCMLCGKPLPERVGTKTYTEFRTDCGSHSSPSGPSAADMTKPAVDFAGVAKGGAEMNGFCALNFAKSCADAVANRDYLYWPKSLDLASAQMSANAPWDARYCSLNGFLQREIVALQHNFTGMREKAQDLCRTKYERHGIEKLTFLDMMSRSRYDDAEAPTREEAELLAAWNCAMGDLGCDMAMCAYSFCQKEAGKTGLYSECAGWDPVSGMPF